MISYQNNQEEECQGFGCFGFNRLLSHVSKWADFMKEARKKTCLDLNETNFFKITSAISPPFSNGAYLKECDHMASDINGPIY
jgi:hypothetical protein